MAKKNSSQEEPKSGEMSLEEARAYRASLHKQSKASLSDSEKREQFRIFWAQEKNKHSKIKDLEKILWAHLKASKLDSPEQFEEGLKHFGLKIK